MGRSFSFEPFSANAKEVSRRITRENKQAVAGQHPEAELDTGIHYGKKNAETIERLQARQMNAQLEELAGIKAEPEKMSKTARGEEGEAGLPKTTRQPIGALPLTPEKFSAGMFSELYEEGARYAEMLMGSLKDARTATGRLARLPVEAASLLIRRYSPKKA